MFSSTLQRRIADKNKERCMAEESSKVEVRVKIKKKREGDCNNLRLGRNTCENV